MSFEGGLDGGDDGGGNAHTHALAYIKSSHSSSILRCSKLLHSGEHSFTLADADFPFDIACGCI